MSDPIIKVYVAAPYSGGDVEANVRAAIYMGDQLAEQGYIPFIPHLSHYWHRHHERPYEFWMRYTREWLLACHAVMRLSGHSPGADQEELDARTADIPVFRRIEALNRWAIYSGRRCAVAKGCFLS